MNKKNAINKSKTAIKAVYGDSYAFKNLKISLGIIIGVFAFVLYAQSISFD
jgi:hypothetical protein